MDEELPPSGEDKEVTPTPSDTPGQRLDQFIGRAKRLRADMAQKAKEMADAAAPRLKEMEAGAKRIGMATSQRAKEIADAAAPKLKEMGTAASQAASQALKNRSGEGSVATKLRNYYESSDPARKGLLMYGGIIGVLLLLSVIVSVIALPIIWMAGGFTSGPGAPTPDTFWTSHSGHWQLAIEDPHGGSVLFRFDVQNEGMTLLDSGMRIDGKEYWDGKPPSTIEPPTILPTGKDDATIKIWLMAASRTIKVHVAGKDVTGAAAVQTIDIDLTRGEATPGATTNEGVVTGTVD